MQSVRSGKCAGKAIGAAQKNHTSPHRSPIQPCRPWQVWLAIFVCQPTHPRLVKLRCLAVLDVDSGRRSRPKFHSFFGLKERPRRPPMDPNMRILD